MPKRNRSEIKQKIEKKLEDIPNECELLPMHYETETIKGKISIEEWEEFHQRKMIHNQAKPSYENEFGQPLACTTKTVLELLTPNCPDIHKTLESLLVCRTWMTEAEKQKCRQAIKTAFVIVLDTFVNAGLAYGIITYNNLFDALCREFSDHHRLNLANSVRDMWPNTAGCCRRDLLLNGIDINELWDLVVRHWSQPDLNPLFQVCKPTYSGKGQLIRILPKHSDVLTNFREIVSHDPQLVHSHIPGIKALFEQVTLPKKQPRCKVCAEKRYNEVKLGERSEELLRLQYNSVLQLDVDAFKQDYESADGCIVRLGDKLKRDYGIDLLKTEYDIDLRLSDVKRQRRENGHETKIWSDREKHVFYTAIEKGLGEIGHEQQVIADAQSAIKDDPNKWARHLERFLRWRLKYRGEQSPDQPRPSVEEIAKAAQVTKEWRQEVRQLLTQYDQAQRHVDEYKRVYEQVKGKCGLHSIRCGFDRIINRRYQPLHFWPTYVSSKNINLEDKEEPEIYYPTEGEQSSFRKRWFKAFHPGTGNPCALVGLDISSSQTQIIATLFGIENLEKLTMGRAGKSFKEALAEWAWQKDQCPNDNFRLNKGSKIVQDYKLASDQRLQTLCKELWMRTSYGGHIQSIIEDQKSDPKTFGPGWTIENANSFLQGLYNEFPGVRKFLEMCRHIGQLAYDKDPCAGVTFTDPSDGAKVRWNPVAREDVKKGNRGHKLIFSLPRKATVVQKDGENKKGFEEFPPNNDKEYPVDSERLKRMVAPCLIQMIDAYYSTLVMEQLAKQGIAVFVGIHDCWLVAEKVSVNGKICDGEKVVRSAMDEAAGEWYAGLESIYGELLKYLESDQEYKDFILVAKKKWEKRVAEKYKPVFMAKSS